MEKYSWEIIMVILTVICDHYKECESILCPDKQPRYLTGILMKNYPCWRIKNGKASHERLSKFQIIMWNKLNGKK